MKPMRIFFWLGLIGLTLAFQRVSAQSVQQLPAHTVPGDLAPSATADDQTAPFIAQGDGTLLAVWQDARAEAGNYFDTETARDIYGMRLDASGTPIDALPFAIATVLGGQENPQAVWNGTHWLVIFETYTVNGTGYYYEKMLAFTRVTPDGEVLDNPPVTMFGVTPGTGMWSVDNDGATWIVVYSGTTAGGTDIMVSRISADGVVLDPPATTLVPGSWYTRSNVQVACAAGVCLLTYNDPYFGGGYYTGAVRFDGNLTILSGPFGLLDQYLTGLVANGGGFYVVWHGQVNFNTAIFGARVDLNGTVLDPGGDHISGSSVPQYDSRTALVWDGTYWKVVWRYNSAARVARITTGGQVLDPGGVAVSGPSAGQAAATSTGGVQLIWSEFANNNYDIRTANISAANVAGPNRTVSLGAPMQLRADVAAGNNGYMVVYRSSTGDGQRVLAQPLDAAGVPLTAEPVELDSGDTLTGPGSPSVAWNGALYMVSWGNSQGVVAQRLQPDGSKIDAAPFVVMNPGFGAADIAAIGDTFLITARKFGYTVQIINVIAARVRGSDGVVLDTPPLLLGGIYVRTAPVVINHAGRWMVVYHSNWTHDESNADTQMVFVNPDGSQTGATNLYLFSTAGGNAIFEIGAASNGTVALVVQSAEITSGVETDLVGRLINADGSLQPTFNMTPWVGNQYRPRVGWDGAHFVMLYQEQRNRFGALDQIDARSDLFGMRVTATGTIVDPTGFVWSNSAEAEGYPTVESTPGVNFFAASIMRNQLPYMNYRIGYDLWSSANQWPVAQLTASPAGDVPVTVTFSSAGSNDPDGTISSYLWAFGDGATSTAANPSHTYTTPGPFVATLTVTDNGGAATTNAVFVNATPPNQLPVAVASANTYSGPAPLAVTLYSTGSYDPDGSIGNYEWTFSDGGTYWGATAYHTFSTPGTHSATLTVHDNRGGTGSDTITFDVLADNQLPTAVASATPTSGDPPLTVAFTGSGSFDPDGTIVGYAWAFGDGATSTEADPTHVYTSGGQYVAVLTVTDNWGGVDSAEITIDVTCNANCLRSGAISLKARNVGSSVQVTGKVYVVTETGAKVRNALVSITWTLPGGYTADLSVYTDNRGIATFSTSGNHGTFTLTVNDITKSGYQFDPDNSVLTRSITK